MLFRVCVNAFQLKTFQNLLLVDYVKMSIRLSINVTLYCKFIIITYYIRYTYFVFV